MAKNRKARKQPYNNNNNHSTQQDTNTIDLDKHRAKKVILTPRNLNQETYISLLQDQQLSYVFAHGPAGTGKTMLAVMQAIKEFQEGTVDKIIITRPAVGVDDEKHGFLPGDINEKMAPWTRPIFDVLKEYYSPKHIEKLMEEEKIEISPLAFMRGRNFHNSFVICDEAQNMSENQMKMLLTRLGENSRMAITGDLNQSDMEKNNGFKRFLNILANNKSDLVDAIKFDKKDIQRSEGVKEVLRLYDSA